MAGVKKGSLTWDVPALAKAMQISDEEVEQYFRDGRRVSFVIERRMAREVLKGKLAPSEGASFDVMDAAGGKWESRSLSSGGIYFCPSYMIGSGRKFDLAGFQAKLAAITGYVISDIAQFPTVPYWLVDVGTVQAWWGAGSLNANSQISRAAALTLLAGLPI